MAAARTLWSMQVRDPQRSPIVPEEEIASGGGPVDHRGPALPPPPRPIFFVPRIQAVSSAMGID
jgi:hypothetical protein